MPAYANPNPQLSLDATTVQCRCISPLYPQLWWYRFTILMNSSSALRSLRRCVCLYLSSIKPWCYNWSILIKSPTIPNHNAPTLPFWCLSINISSTLRWELYHTQLSFSVISLPCWCMPLCTLTMLLSTSSYLSMKAWCYILTILMHVLTYPQPCCYRLNLQMPLSTHPQLWSKSIALLVIYWCLYISIVKAMILELYLADTSLYLSPV